QAGEREHRHGRQRYFMHGEAVLQLEPRTTREVRESTNYCRKLALAECDWSVCAQLDDECKRSVKVDASYSLTAYQETRAMNEVGAIERHRLAGSLQLSE